MVTANKDTAKGTGIDRTADAWGQVSVCLLQCMGSGLLMAASMSPGH